MRYVESIEPSSLTSGSAAWLLLSAVRSKGVARRLFQYPRDPGSRVRFRSQCIIRLAVADKALRIHRGLQEGRGSLEGFSGPAQTSSGKEPLCGGGITSDGLHVASSKGPWTGPSSTILHQHMTGRWVVPCALRILRAHTRTKPYCPPSTPLLTQGPQLHHRPDAHQQDWTTTIPIHKKGAGDHRSPYANAGAIRLYDTSSWRALDSTALERKHGKTAMEEGERLDLKEILTTPKLAKAARFMILTRLLGQPLVGKGLKS
ncbi:hypothetical protein PAAG_05500 [Paracoccidioides lutzii Pb01]|uniref:Uncharacterized protein n=1 Tax=Paracoccidioides lutzii (strain ATCC MYA-826 / Pb01) TaxID=502779 RepID=C1H407_PARBA|nr:hypothetical protein PAAG_05500 [Paracoccidioides lutzii Pb01]EEH34451.2 hypothetical protein PAAG_05500 [Paracoccidioides lutzii Pb01]